MLSIIVKTVLVVLASGILSQAHRNFNQTNRLKLATKCDFSACKLPHCRCSGEPLLGKNFENKEKDIPQFVTVTFDDAVTALNYPQYQALFADLRNPNNCSIRGTFFATHEYTDYSKVHGLAMDGHEIALHSVTHGDGTEYWLNANGSTLLQEFGGQMKMLMRYANISRTSIRGMRLPFLQQSGNVSYVVAKRLGLLYDSSWPTQQYKDPAMWPYTLDYKSVQDCQIGPCPQVSIPGLWVSPMVSWTDTKGYNCAMLDACVFPPAGNDEDALFSWMMDNFNRHYEGNRAPFGMYLHAAWFARGSKHFNSMRRFLKTINTLPNVHITTISKVIEFMASPTLEVRNLTCPKVIRKTNCQPRTCALRKNTSNEMRYMTICGRCPAAYPWIGNPLGKSVN